MVGQAPLLPDNWQLIEISEICMVNPKLDKGDIPGDLDIAFVPMSAVQAGSGVIDVSETRKFAAVKKGYTPFKEGDVIFAKITPCMENGKMAIVPEVRNDIGFGSTEFHVLRALSGVNAKYVYYYVSSQAFRHEAEHNMSGAVGQRRVTTPYLSSCDIPLPPTNEQLRIVAKIEELFSELDKGIENLKIAQAQLKVYRQALLKHAFEGKLTAQWRADNQDKLETADALLKRIQQERAQRYQQQLADWEASGKQGSKPKTPKPLPPLTAEELAELPVLPAGWGWARIGEATSCLDNFRVPINKTERLSRHGNVPYYGANGQVGWINDYLFDEPLILVVEDETFTGREKPFSYKITGKSWVNNHAHILKPLPGVDIDYLNFQLFYYPFTAITTGTTGRKKLTQEAMNNAPIRICSHQEQMAIVERLAANISEIDQLEQTIVTSLQQAEALRQSILKRAFSGQLVPQDSHDEPASALLARIHAEREQSDKPRRGGKVA
jgi:type I restriction enzyme S subunit